MNRRQLAALVLSALSILTAHAISPSEPRVDGAYLNDWKLTRLTPHLEFARPAAWPRVRALFLVPHNLAAREVGELEERLDVTADVVSVLDESMFGADERYGVDRRVFGMLPEEKEAELLEKLRQPHDVIVFGNFQFGALPDSCRLDIVRQVRAGTGLLLVYRNDLRMLKTELEANVEATDRDWIWKNLPLPLLPYLNSHWTNPPRREQLGTFRLGQGRVAVIDYQVPANDDQASAYYGGPSLAAPAVYNAHLPTAYDGLLALPARALLWAARKVPATRLELAGPLLTGAGDDLVITGHVVSAEAFPATVSVLVTDTEGREKVRLSQPLAVAAGDNLLTVALPPLPGGRFFANLWLRREGKTLDWGTVAVEAGPRSFETVDIGPRAMDPGGSVTCTVKVLRALAPQETLQLRLRDVEGRVLQQTALTVEGQQAQGTLAVRDAGVGVELRPEFVLLRDGVVVESRQEDNWTVFIRIPSDQRYHFVLWGGNNAGMPGYYAYDAYRELGLDAVLHWPRADHNQLHAALGLETVFMPYNLGTGNKDDPKLYRDRYLPQRNGFPLEAWTHPEDRPAYLETWRQYVTDSWQRNGNRALAYNLGDEILLGGREIGYRDWWLVPFRKQMQGVYGTVDKLNVSWGAAYTSFDEVKPGRCSDAMTVSQFKEKIEQANDRSFARPTNDQQKVLSYAPYLDHRRFVEGQFVSLVTNVQSVIRQVDPAGRLGWEGAGVMESYYGFDLPALARVAGMWAPYRTRSVNEIIRSFKHDDMVFGNWFGAYIGERWPPPGRSRFTMWDMLFSGANTVWFYIASGSEGGLNLDLSLTPFVTADELRLLNGGLGEWLARARIQEDAVAVHYSQASCQVTSFEYPWGYYQNVQESWTALLFDLGLRHHYLDQQAMEAGELNSGKYRLLILPNSVALSAREADEIRAFVRKGGTVLADLRPGVLTEHGRYLPQGQLDDLFGIAHKTTFRQTKLQDVAASVPSHKVALELSSTDIDPTVTLTTGKGALLADGTPAVIENGFGKGRAVLLNFNIYPYSPITHDGRFLKNQPLKKATGLLELAGQYVQAAGVVPACRVTNAEGKPVPRVRTSLFRSGDAQVLGVLRDIEQDNRSDTLAAPIVGTLGNMAYLGPVPVKIDLGGKYWVYDLVEKKSLGRTRELSVTLEPSRARLFTLLGKEEKPLKIEAAPTTARPGQDVRVAVTAPRSDHALILLELYDTAGQPCRWFRRFVTTEKGRASAVMPLAWSEKPGLYNLVAASPLTGNRAVTTLTVAADENNRENVLSNAVISLTLQGNAQAVVAPTVPSLRPDPAAAVQPSAVELPAAMKALAPWLWLRADAGLSSAGNGKVVRWADQGGKGHDAVAGDALGGPVPVGNAINAVPALEFSWNQLYTPALAATQGTIFVVGKWSGELEANRPETTFLSTRVGAYDAGFEMELNQKSQVFLRCFRNKAGSVTTATKTVGTNSWFIASVCLASNQVGVAVNGGPAVTLDRQYEPATRQPVSIGFRIGESGSSNFHGEIGEVLFFDRVLADDGRSTVQNYLSARYQIPLESK